MWLRVSRSDRIYWLNLDRVGMIKLDFEDEYALKVYVDSDLGAFITRSPDTTFTVFEDERLAIQAMLDDICQLPVHPSYLQEYILDPSYLQEDILDGP
jgi:hypothetical protein